MNKIVPLISLLLSLFSSCVNAQLVELVSDGSFEIELNTPSSPWLYTSDNSGGLFMVTDDGGPFELGLGKGIIFANFGAFDYLSQTLIVNSGSTLTLSFDLNRGGTGFGGSAVGVFVDVNLGGNKIFSCIDSACGPGDTNKTTNFIVNTITTQKNPVLTFALRNDPSNGILRNVSAKINTPVPSPVPEPETYAMLALGVAVIGALSRRKKTIY